MTRELFGPDDPNDGIYGSGRIIPFTSPGGGILCCDGRQLVGV
jgi:hypothetical protein